MAASDEVDPYQAPNAPLIVTEPVRTGQSLLGVASFALAVATLMALVVAFAVIGVLVSDPNRSQDSIGGAAGAGALLMLAAMASCCLSVVLGVAALLQRTRRRAFGVVGLLVSGGIVAIFTTLFVLGLAMRS